MNTKILESIGLTKGEAKVYLALLRLTEPSAKGAIVKESRVAHSKVYDILEKLMLKGLASSIIKNGVKHFSPAPPSRIQDYLESKKAALEEDNEKVKEVLPQLNALYTTHSEKASTEVYVGWKGLETVYYEYLREAKKGEEIEVLGASEGTDHKKTRRFYFRYGKIAHEKGLKIRLIYNEKAREYAKSFESHLNVPSNSRFLFNTPPIEFTITRKGVLIIMLKEEPLVILIKDEETAKSFKSYFNALWKVAKR